MFYLLAFSVGLLAGMMTDWLRPFWVALQIYGRGFAISGPMRLQEVVLACRMLRAWTGLNWTVFDAGSSGVKLKCEEGFLPVLGRSVMMYKKIKKFLRQDKEAP